MFDNPEVFTITLSTLDQFTAVLGIIANGMAIFLLLRYLKNTIW